MSATERLDAAIARAEAATEGPWRATEGATKGQFWVELPHRATICDMPYEQGAQEDAEFIAHARQDIPDLAGAIRDGIAQCNEEILGASDLLDSYPAANVALAQQMRRWTADRILRAITARLGDA